MGSIFGRKGTTKLYAKIKATDGTWKQIPTPFSKGEELQAEAWMLDLERQVDEQTARTTVLAVGSSMTIRQFAEKWLDGRNTETVDDDRSRIENHILPALGDVQLGKLRPRQVRDFVAMLSKKKKLGNLKKNGERVETDELLAPRTVRHIYGTLRAMLNDAVADELIPTNPCVLKDELPEKKDKDRTWRRTAVFARDEVQTIISDERIPEDRRVLDALLLIGAMRFGEAAALTWRDYDAASSPLGKLVIERSYNSKSRETKGTKTDNPREMPVHPTLAKILAAWKLGGWERLMGRDPKPDDLIVPSRRGNHRNANHMLRRFHEDLERVGLRERRQHDGRRTFISIARSDGAVKDLLRWCTHGSEGDVFDDYTTPTWPALCAEVAKAKIDLLEGKVIEMPIAANDHQTAWCSLGAETESVKDLVSLSRGADGTRRGGNLHALPAVSSVSSQPAAASVSRSAIVREAPAPSLVQADPIATALVDAAESWGRSRDERALRRALLKLLGELE